MIMTSDHLATAPCPPAAGERMTIREFLATTSPGSPPIPASGWSSSARLEAGRAPAGVSPWAWEATRQSLGVRLGRCWLRLSWRLDREEQATFPVEELRRWAAEPRRRRQAPPAPFPNGGAPAPSQTI